MLSVGKADVTLRDSVPFGRIVLSSLLSYVGEVSHGSCCCSAIELEARPHISQPLPLVPNKSSHPLNPLLPLSNTYTLLAGEPNNNSLSKGEPSILNAFLW